MASPVDLPDGSTHRVEGVGTIKLPIGEHMEELKNARHVPTLHAHLLSFNQLEDQGFHIKTADEKPYRLQIIIPDKSDTERGGRIPAARNDLCRSSVPP